MSSSPREILIALVPQQSGLKDLLRNSNLHEIDRSLIQAQVASYKAHLRKAHHDLDTGKLNLIRARNQRNRLFHRTSSLHLDTR